MAITLRSSSHVQLTGVVPKPTGTIAGDVMVATVATNGAPTPPSGWTQQAQANFSTLYLTHYTKVAGGSEPSSYTWTAATSMLEAGIDTRTGVDTTTPVTGTPTQNGAFAASTAPGSITTGAANALLVMGGFGYALGNDGTGVSWSGSGTERWEENYLNTYFLDAQDEAIASAGATGTRTVTIAGTLGSGSLVLGVMLALNPAAGTDATVNAAVATATAAMQVPTVTAAATIAAPLLTATAAMLVPSVAVTVSVAPPVLTATAQMYAPTVTAAANVAAPLLTATALMPAPAVGVPNGVTAPVLTATGQLLAPAITAEATIAAPVLTATAAMQTPSVSIDVIVSPLTLTATAQMPTPTVTAAASISAPLLTATAAFLTPVVTGEVWIDAPLLTASAELLAPSVIAEAVVGDVPVLTSAAEMPIPFVGVAPPTTPWAGGQMQPGTQRGVRGSVSARAGVTGTVRQRAGVTMKETP